jgi:hypothetical protein
LKGEGKQSASIFADDKERSYHVSIHEPKSSQMTTYIGTEFCFVLLAALGGEKDPNKSIWELSIEQFPSKFVSTFGANRNSPIRKFFGDNIANYTTKYTIHNPIFHFVSFSPSNGSLVSSLISPKLHRLFKVVLGYSPTKEQLSAEISEDTFQKYHNYVRDIAKLLREEYFIIIDKFPAGRSVFLFAQEEMDTIRKGIEVVKRETSVLNSNIK